MVSSGNAKRLSCNDWMIFSYDPPGRSVRPMLPANSVSPATSFFSRLEVQTDRTFRVSRCVNHLRVYGSSFHAIAGHQALVD